jgi:dihydrofolate reductase
MILTHIVACSKNHVIGTEGDLPWSLPEDMKFFRETTKGHIMIMGRKTFDSFKGRALPHRYHIVITRDPSKREFPASASNPVVFVGSLEEALEKARPLTAQWGEEVFVIGGGEIYRQSMPHAHKLLVTLIDREFDGDTYYPEIDDKVFKLTEKKEVAVPIPFSFLTYLRRPV